MASRFQLRWIETGKATIALHVKLRIKNESASFRSDGFVYKWKVFVGRLQRVLTSFCDNGGWMWEMLSIIWCRPATVRIWWRTQWARWWPRATWIRAWLLALGCLSIWLTHISGSRNRAATATDSTVRPISAIRFALDWKRICRRDRLRWTRQDPVTSEVRPHKKRKKERGGGIKKMQWMYSQKYTYKIDTLSTTDSNPSNLAESKHIESIECAIRRRKT